MGDAETKILGGVVRCLFGSQMFQGLTEPERAEWSLRTDLPNRCCHLDWKGGVQAPGAQFICSSSSFPCDSNVISSRRRKRLLRVSSR